MRRLRWLFAVGAADEGRLRFSGGRTRAYDGQRGDEILDAAQRQPLQRGAHGRRLDLEAADGAGFAQGGERRRVRVRHLDRPAEQTQRLLDGAQSPVAEEIDLHQADFLEGMHVVLGHKYALGGALQGSIAIDARLGDDDAAGMDRNVL